MRFARALAFLIIPAVSVAQPVTPAGWQWRLEKPAKLVPFSQTLADSAWMFVGMPPGWHITTGPGVLLFNPAEQAIGRYSLSADFILFPNPTDSPFGIVLGGSDLASGASNHVAAQLRRDGSVRVIAVEAGKERELAPWKVHTAIKPHPGGDVTVANRLRIAVAPDSLRVFVNDSSVVRVSAAQLRTAGQFGLQVGEKLNFHITTLDLIRHLAPGRTP